MLTKSNKHTSEIRTAETGPYRLNLTLNAEAKAELDTLKVAARKSTLVDVIRAALAVYKLIVDHQQAGGRVVFRQSDNSEETLRFV